MTDNRSYEDRRKNMAAIRSKGTGPEIVVRRTLHSLGFRFRLHAKSMPGTPDIVLPRYRAVVLVHGCFWHGHGCPRSSLPKTRTDFWCDKIRANQARDAQTTMALQALSWRVCIVWSCAVAGRTRWSNEALGSHLAGWILSGEGTRVIQGHQSQ